MNVWQINRGIKEAVEQAVRYALLSAGASPALVADERLLNHHIFSGKGTEVFFPQWPNKKHIGEDMDKTLKPLFEAWGKACDEMMLNSEGAPKIS